MFEQDTDVVIKVINYLIERADSEPEPAALERDAQTQTKKHDEFWDYV